MKKSRSALSCYVVIDSRVNPKGLSKILFRIQQARVKRDIYLGITWPKACFSQASQQLLPRHADDPDVEPYNLQINEYKARAHRMALTGYLDKTDISIDDIMADFKNMHVTEDFFSFMAVSANELYNQDTIQRGTWMRHKSSLNVLRYFWPKETLPIGRITLEFIEKLDAWARSKHKVGHNTTCGYHKDFKKYLSIAVRKCIIAKNPYENFSFAYVDGDRIALNEQEVGSLITVFKEPRLEFNDREILRRFLFSCFTGLRISDTDLIHSKMIHGNDLVFVPFKGRSQGKILRLPLQKIALQLIEGCTGMLFEKYSHAYINERLKIIGARAGIYKRLTYHCARDTFGTQAVEMNIHIKLISDMMGHSSLKTTSIYLKMSDAEKRRAMGKFDDRYKL